MRPPDNVPEALRIVRPLGLSSAISVGMLLVVLALALAAEHISAARRFEQAVDALAADFAQAFVARDDLASKKLAESLAAEDLSQLIVRVGDVDVARKEQRLTPAVCWFPIRRPIRHYAVEVGGVSACLDSWALMRHVVASPWVVLVAAGMAVGAGLAASYPLARYQRTLARSLRILRKWTVSPGQDLPDVVAGDPVLDSMMALVREGLEKDREAKRSLHVAEKLEELARVTAHVAHDIKSPLAALEVVVSETDNLDETIRLLLRSSVARVRDIANQLLATNAELAQRRGGPGAAVVLTEVLLSALVSGIVSEKRLEYRRLVHVTIEAPPAELGYGLFTNANVLDLKRSISNCINNAVESMGERGEVRVTLGSDGVRARLSIADQGPGIPGDVAEGLGSRPVRSTKHERVGLGLSQAHRAMAQAGGHLDFDTGKDGTRVDLVLPLVEPPPWFPAALVCPPSVDTIVVVDDDQAIHHVWEQRFSGRAKTIAHFSSMAACRRCLDEGRFRRAALFLVDFEFLHEAGDGLEFLRQEGLVDRAVLVTSHYDEPDLQDQCRALGLKMLPKELALLVPIRVCAEGLPQPAGESLL